MNRTMLCLSFTLLLLPGWACAQDGFLGRVWDRSLPSTLPFSAGQALPQAPPPGESLDATPGAGGQEAEQNTAPALTPPAGHEETLPGPGERVLVPLSKVGVPGEVQFEENGDRVSLVVRDASLSYVLALLAERRGLNIVAANDIDALVSITLYDKTVEEALTAILSVANYTWTFHNGIIYVTSLAQSTTLPPEMQGRRIQVFPLDYVSAQALLLTVQSFLSPVGQAFATESDQEDNRRTREALVVEDVPYALERVAAFVHQMDQPPRQVLIEAHILQVDLNDGRQHGVNFEHLFSLMGNEISLRSVGMSSASASPAFFASVNGGNLTTLIQLLKTTTDAKTLASPRLLVINEQRARLQVGEQLGYRVTTTTETSTLESVNFLDVGVILEITPRITRDNRILLHVRPEVSGGQVNPDTGLPDSETAHLETSVMLEDGYGVVIGGLIKESDSVNQSKVPYLGDLYLIGKLFQREDATKERSEIIVVLIPRVHPYTCDYAAYEKGNVVRAETDLFEGPLLRRARPWAPKLPDTMSNPRILRLPPIDPVCPQPVAPLDWAATSQPQRQFPILPRPGPAVRLDSEPMYGEQLPPHHAEPFDSTGVVAPNLTRPNRAMEQAPPASPTPAGP